MVTACKERRGEIEDLVGQAPDVGRCPARRRVEDVQVAARLLEDRLRALLRGRGPVVELGQGGSRSRVAGKPVAAVVHAPAALVGDAFEAVAFHQGGVRLVRCRVAGVGDAGGEESIHRGGGVVVGGVVGGTSAAPEEVVDRVWVGT